MHWREKRVNAWLLICVVVLVASAFYIRSQQLARETLAEPVLSRPGPEEVSGQMRDQDFYVEQRLSRDRVRSQEMDTLREIIHNPGTSHNNRTEAESRLIYLSEEQAKETSTEALIKAKGFADAIVYLHSNSVHVLVKAANLTVDEVTCIGDIVAKSLEIPLENISIGARP
ncbi:MAG: SpoIIIAH-like family protein [Firmicutes bacterium]|nr:SpoIIIAH-like family protein [Bacillota bacterium]